MSPPDDRGKVNRVSEGDVKEILKDEKKRKRLATALSRAMWQEEKEQLERERARGMKN